jgi:hypothetical protein
MVCYLFSHFYFDCSTGTSTGNDLAGLYYTKGNEIYDFWSAVVKPDAVVADTTARKLSFVDGDAMWGWTRDADELYIRDCYKEAIRILDNADMAMIEGTPGIGKSLFIFYFIYTVVRQAKDNSQEIPTFLIEDRDGNGYFLRVDDNGNGIVHKPTTETPDYLITDTKGRSNPSFAKLYLHVSSINNVNVKDVKKLMDQRQPRAHKTRSVIYLPGFSLEEYLEIDGGKVDQVSMYVVLTQSSVSFCDVCNVPVYSVQGDMSFYYDVFGGSLRNLRSAAQLDQTDPYPEEIYDVVQAEMTSFFGGCELAGISKATWDKTAEALAKKLQNPNEGSKDSGAVDPNTISRSIIIHWTPSGTATRGWLDLPATRFMRHLAGHICNSANRDALSRLSAAIGPSGMGWVHEHDAHQFRLTHLPEEPGITLWSLQNKDAGKLCLPIRRVVRIRTVSDIERLEVGDYGLPTVSNFPLVDAVLKPHYLFQDTVAKGRHSSVARAPDILAALNTTDRGSVLLINTLATANFDNFKANGSAAMKPLSQWKTRMEAHADDVAVVTALSVTTASEASNSRKRQRRDPAVEVQPNGKKARSIK